MRYSYMVSTVIWQPTIEHSGHMMFRFLVTADNLQSTLLDVVLRKMGTVVRYWK